MSLEQDTDNPLNELRKAEMNNENPEQTPTTSATDNLIPVFTTDIGGVAQSAVNARKLHEFLGVKWDFSSWIKKRIRE